MKKIFFLSCISLALFYSCVKNNSLDTPQLTIDLLEPTDGAENQPLNAVLKWEIADLACADFEYSIYLGETIDDLRIVYSDSSELAWNEIIFECQNLDFLTKYYWKIKGSCGDRKFESDIQEFTTSSELQNFTFMDKTIEVYPYSYLFESGNNISQIWNLPHATSMIDGYNNTLALVERYENHIGEAYYEAAKYCNSLIAFGYDDWYLPAFDELTSIASSGDIYLPDEQYWSSTELDEFNAYTYYFGGSGAVIKITGGKCRCVREK